MLTIKDLNLDRKLSVGIGLCFSSEVLHFYEAEYPAELWPRKAIKSAIRWINNPCKETGSTARAAASSAADAAYAAYAADAADAAYAGYAAYYAAYTTAAHVAPAANAAYAAANAANAAYATDYACKEMYVHDRIVKILPLILEYKIENEQQFNNAEKVLEYLNDDDKGSFLFNLDILR